jgi:Fe-S-cluster-containing dehydrogenase component
MSNFNWNFSIRDPAPCMGCTERFTACSDRCPKDARGEYGYEAWRKALKAVEKNRQEYNEQKRIGRK